MIYFQRNYTKEEREIARMITFHIAFFIIVLIIQLIGKFTNVLAEIYPHLYLSPEKFYYKPWTILTYGFVIDSPWRLLYNMLWLHTLGNMVVYLLNDNHFVLLYLLGILGGGIAYLLVYNYLPYFVDKLKISGIGTKIVGSSAGLYALLAGAASFAPKFSISIFFFYIELQYAALLVCCWTLIHLAHTNEGEAVDIANLIGALVGFIYIQHFKLQQSGIYTYCLRSIKRFLRQSAKSTQEKNIKKTSKKINHSNQEEIDNILDKIARNGYKSLNDEEKKNLFNAGKGKE